jgi:anaerobic magnesium-protoporphyrin IX monomethyl ester cyclase
MLDYLQKFKPDLIGLNTTSPCISDTVESVAIIRKIYSGLAIAGGHHATALPELTLQKIPGLDGVVKGEGEMATLKIAMGENPETIPGVWWRKRNGTIGHTPPHQIENLDDLPFPDLNLLDMDFYTSPSLDSIRGHFLSVAPILTSRGCTNRCDFCAESLTYGRGIRFHSPEYVIEWVKKILVEYQVEGIYLCDNNFLAHEERAREICEKILSKGLNRNFKWAIQARANSIHPDILRLLKKAGCILIELGIESTSQVHLNSIHKGTTLSINERAIALCRKERIYAHAFFMTGFEGETLSDLDQGLRWIKQAKPDSFSWYPLDIHPGTALYQKRGNQFFEKNEWTEENISRYYGVDHLSSISKKERDRWKKKYLQPYQKWHYRVTILRVNPISKLAPLFIWRIKEYFRNGYRRLKHEQFL